MKFLPIAILMLSSITIFGQEVTALDIIKKADEKVRGTTSRGEITMKIVRPTWTREMSMKSWSKGTELALILVTAPARDKGIVNLKRDKELWNWQPSIDRVIKLPPSMMLQSWMGSDFTNDDLVKESSIVEDYKHEIVGDSTIRGYDCYKIELIPKENAPVVWGKIMVWVSKKEYLQLLTKFYDEDGYLVNTLVSSDVKEMDGRLLPTHLEMIPADKEGHKTIIDYNSLKFDEPYDDDFFSIQNMKRIR